jgi:hypothetical protein
MMLVADGMGAAADAIDAHRSGVYAADDSIRDVLVPTQSGANS